MSKLYPPYIEGTIPAFCDTKEGTVLTVPFSMNRAVSKKEVVGFYLKLKTIQSDRYLITLKSNKYNLETQEVYFDLTSVKNKLNIGQFYKIQIAYVGSDVISSIGYYSSVGVVKYTSKPSIYIEGLEKNVPNRHSYNYLGCYSQESLGENDTKDYSEKVYSYRFFIEDKLNNIIADSGWLLHNNSKDINSYESQDEFSYMSDFEINKNYYIKYQIKTNNGLEVSSPKYKIISRRSIMPNVKTKPIPILDFDNGFVDINLDASNYISEEGSESTVNGSFVLSRRISNGGIWEEILRFSLLGKKLSTWHWKDFTVEQGKTYIYSIQEYNDNDLYSERIESKKIYVDFEDSFLFDGKRQLRIRFNPKVSSFKTTLLESKIDTIGSKYPFFFRNGNVEYKEFPISGLISYQMDDGNLFGFEENFILTENFTREKTEAEYLKEYKVKTTNLIGYNFSAERDFKLEVLNWLNNGEPKLFRSPSEGNYIVRLLNVSLSPEDTISRLIHTFNATAYEVAEYNYKNLNEYNFISITESTKSNIIYTRWMTVQLKDKYAAINDTSAPYIEIMSHQQATSVYFYDMQPGDMVYINGKSIIIGATGSYYIDNGEIIESIGIPYGVTYTGQVTYSFEDSSKNTFDTIIDVQIDDVVADQFIGRYENILERIEDIKTKVSHFYYLDFQKRDVDLAYANWLGEEQGYETKDGIICLYADKNCNIKINSFNGNDEFKDPFKIYKYNISQVVLETSEGLMISKGFTEVNLTEEDFILSQEQLQNRYYIKKEDGEYETVTNYDPSKKYYMKKSYEFYYDPKQPTNIFVTEDTKRRLEQFEKDKLSYIGPFSGFVVKGDFYIYENKCYIDGEEIDLADDVQVKINSLTQFKTIKLEAGVVLNCGYELQYLEYFNESELEEYYLLKDLQKILNTNWQDTKEIFYLNLLKSTGLDQFIENLKNRDMSLQVAARKYYFETIMEAHRIYRDISFGYINKLTKLLEEQEVVVK